MQEKLGIVYTPIEVVDFIIHSIKYALNKHLSDKDIHILDPFTGTGSFITRLIQGGLINSNLAHKYENEIWANEITLLGYYIAQLNITATYHKQLLALQNNAQKATHPSIPPPPPSPLRINIYVGALILRKCFDKHGTPLNAFNTATTKTNECAYINAISCYNGRIANNPYGKEVLGIVAKAEKHNNKRLAKARARNYFKAERQKLFVRVMK